MANLFKKAAIFTDLHFGAKSNSDGHNQDCLEFMQWFIEQAKLEGCETCLFLGDYHNNRNSMNLRTMSYAIRGLELLSQNFEHTYFIPGNHDLFFKDKRDVHSVDWAKHIPNVTIVNDWFNAGDVIIAPWLVGDDYKRVKKLSGKYMFGHFELPSFYMNAMIQMPDHGEISRKDFAGIEHCFSGHFHKRQTQGNITYIGNAFPHNYADAWDDERGMTILEWGKEPVFRSWHDAPKFRTLKLSQLLDDADNIIKSKMYMRVAIDLPISFEEASFIKENFVSQGLVRELTLISENKELDSTSDFNVERFESIDQIVSNQIANIQSDNYDPKILLAIYNNL